MKQKKIGKGELMSVAALFIATKQQCPVQQPEQAA